MCTTVFRADTEHYPRHQAYSEHIVLPGPTLESISKQVPSRPFTLLGESVQGFMTTQFEAGQQRIDLRTQPSHSELSLVQSLYIFLPLAVSFIDVKFQRTTTSSP